MSESSQQCSNLKGDEYNYPESTFWSAGNDAYSHTKSLNVLKQYHQQPLATDGNGVCLIVRK